ncbi:enoyl-CoA hydratase [Saccharopolyspora karakumensis]|uniref:Enoyl-CoA hydratase n=1 Tax=Saccharopolyspora karakumensis TaxID=2530386 RepID=A0A4R5BWL8_9PSEU|nr:enoyl-CoA hydratase-related protein [Saccharopolyspora karakumensis]TDD90559.1 enoyl-CoA hydratase [Saccharopolyspora karakumensis]
MVERVTTQDHDTTTVVELNNPPVNSWSDELVTDFNVVLDRIETGPHRSVVITGAGNHFSAGGDFDRFQQVTELESAAVFLNSVCALMERVATLPMPVIAAIQGTALGGGLELALACDVRVASVEARLGQPETRWGLLAGAGGTQRLARLVGPGRAKAMMFSAQPVTGAEAHSIGLVEFLVEGACPLQRAMELGEQIAVNSPRAVRNVKRSVDEGLARDLTTALRLERELWLELIPHGDLREGIASFFERRPPHYPDVL